MVVVVERVFNGYFSSVAGVAYLSKLQMWMICEFPGVCVCALFTGS